MRSSAWTPTTTVSCRRANCPISLAEHRAALAATFAKQDRDRNGVLDARELAAPPQR